MPDTYDPATNPIRLATVASPLPEGDEPYNPIRAAASGDVQTYARPVVEQAQRDKWDWERLASGLKEVNADPEDFAHLKPEADLNAARKRVLSAEGRGETVSQAFRRKFMGFGSLTSLNSLPDVNTGGRFFGGTVVGAKEHYAAQQRFKAGQYTDADLETIARYENQTRTDQISKEAAKKDAAWQALSEIAGLGKLAQEGFVGGAVVSRTARLMGFGRAAAAAPGATVLVPAAETAGRYAAARVAPTLYTPSMWVPQMQQNNEANGRDPNDPKGAPPAIAYGYANTLVLGKLQKGLDAPTVGNALRKGVSATAEMQLVDAAAGVADQFLPKAYKIKPTGEGDFGTVGSWVRAYRAGDKDKAAEALRDATIQAFSFAVFAGSHMGKQPDTLLQRYADTVANLRRSGLTKTEAAEKVQALHDRLDDALSENPHLDREQAAAALRDAADPLTLDYANRLAEVFEPAPKPAPAEPATVAPAEPATVAAPEPRVAGELPAHVETPREVADRLKAEADAAGKEAAKAKDPVEAGRLKLAHQDKLDAWRAAESDYKATREAADRLAEELGTEKQSLTDQIGKAERELNALKVRQRRGDSIDGRTVAGVTRRIQSLRDQRQRADNEIERLKAGGAVEPVTVPGRFPAVEKPAAEPPATTQPNEVPAASGQPAGPASVAYRRAALNRSEIRRLVDEKKATTDPKQILELNKELTRLADAQNKLLNQMTQQERQKFRDTANEAVATVANSAPTANIPATPENPPLHSKAPGEPATGRTAEPPVQPAEPAIAQPERTGSESAPAQPQKSRRQAMLDAVAAAGAKKPVVETAKTPEEIDPATMREQYLAKYSEGLDSSAVSPDTKREQIARMADLFDRLPEYARRSATAHLESVQASESLGDVSVAIAEAMTTSSVPRTRAAGKVLLDEVTRDKDPTVVPGAFDNVTGTLYIDGGGKTGIADAGKYAAPETVEAEQVLAHEIGHVVDRGGKLSDLPEWKKAHRAEIDLDADPLSNYARLNPSEGFAEFFRLVHESDVPHAAIEKEFPLASRFFQDRGLWVDPPQVRRSGGQTTPIPDQFNRRIETDGGHADAVEPKSAATVAAPAKPKVPEPPPPEAVRAWWGLLDVQDRIDLLRDPGFRDKIAADGIDWKEGLPPKAVREIEAKTEKQERTVAKGTDHAADVGATRSLSEGLIDVEALFDRANFSRTELELVNWVAAGKTPESWALDRASKGANLESAQRTAARSSAEAVNKLSRLARESLTEKRDAATGEERDRIDAFLESIAGKKKQATTLNQIVQALGLNRARSLAENPRGVVEGKDVGLQDRVSQFGPRNFVVKLVERLAGKPGRSDRTLYDKIKTQLMGDLPPAAREAKVRELDSRVATYAFDVENGTKDLKAAMRAAGMPYEKLDAATLSHLDAILRGSTPHRQGVPASVLGVLDSMRTQIDRLSRALIDAGAIRGPLKLVFDENMGSYLTRQYEVFRDPKWFEKVGPGVRNRFESWLLGELTAKAEKAGQPPPTQEEVTAETDKLLKNGTAAENPIAFLANTRLGGKDLSILKARKELPPELRALWGEVKDPLVNYTNSVGKMAHLLATHNFLATVAGVGRNKFLFDKPTGGHVYELGDKASENLKPLAGLHTTREIKEALQEAFSRPELSAGMRLYMKAVAGAKLSKTVLSHVGHIRNFLSNVGIAVRNGHWDVSKLPAAFRRLREDTQGGRDYWRDLIRDGVVGHEVSYNDFRETVRDAFLERERYRDGHEFGLLGNLFHNLVKGPVEFAAKWYRYGDTFWKIYGFENERAAYEKAGLSPEAARAKAAEIVSNTTPTYSRMAKAVQNLRRFPLVGPFVSFQAEVVRTTLNTIRQSFAEIHDPNPKVKAIGARRMAGLAAAGTLGWAVAMWSRAQLGVSSADDDDVRRFLPENQKNSRLVYTGRDSEGRLQYTDFSKLDPHAYLADAVIGAWRAKDAAEAVRNAADELFKPFVGEELLVRPLLDVARNQKEPGGAVYNPEDQPADQMATVAKHLAGPFVPGSVGPVRRAVMGQAGVAEQKSGRSYSEESPLAENLAGVRVQSVRVEEELSNKAHEFARRKKDAERAVNELVRAKGQVSPEELKAAQAKTEAALAKVFEDFKKDVDAAINLKVDKGRVSQILREAGVPAADFSYLYGGPRVPYTPQITGPEQQRVRAGQVRSLIGSAERPR